MTGRRAAPWASKQGDKGVASLIGSRRWAGLVRIAAAVHLASRCPADADTRPIRAPNRPISVIDMGGGTFEGLSLGDNKD